MFALETPNRVLGRLPRQGPALGASARFAEAQRGIIVISTERLLCRSEGDKARGIQQPQGCLKGDNVPLKTCFVESGQLLSYLNKKVSE